MLPNLERRTTEVAVRRLHHTNQPERQVMAVTRPAICGTVPVQAMIAALQAEAGAQRQAPRHQRGKPGTG
jgi:hypothetical protein